MKQALRDAIEAVLTQSLRMAREGDNTVAYLTTAYLTSAPDSGRGMIRANHLNAQIRKLDEAHSAARRQMDCAALDELQDTVDRERLLLLVSSLRQCRDTMANWWYGYVESKLNIGLEFEELPWVKRADTLLASVPTKAEPAPTAKSKISLFQNPIAVRALQIQLSNKRLIEDIAELMGDVPWKYKPAMATVEYHTPQGLMIAHCGNWIVRSEDGNMYHFKDEYFRRTYRPAGDAHSPGAAQMDAADHHGRRA